MTEAAVAADPPIEDNPTPAPTPAPTPEATPTPETPRPASEVIEEVKSASPWPDDWREQLAGGDEAFLRQLKRYSAPTTFAKGWKDREDLIRSGKLKVDRPADGADEKALSEWRKANNIPDKPEDYKLPPEIVKELTDEDKPVLSQWTEFAHKKGLAPDAVAAATEWYINGKKAADEAIAEQDRAHKEALEDDLRRDWVGPEYKGNLNLAKRVLDDSPLGAFGWAGLRGPDGKLLGNNAEFMKWAADLGREKFGDPTFANTDVLNRHESRKAEIIKIRNTDFDRYINEGLDKEYRGILELEMKRKK